MSSISSGNFCFLVRKGLSSPCTSAPRLSWCERQCNKHECPDGEGINVANSSLKHSAIYPPSLGKTSLRVMYSPVTFMRGASFSMCRSEWQIPACVVLSRAPFGGVGGMSTVTTRSGASASTISAFFILLRTSSCSTSLLATLRKFTTLQFPFFCFVLGIHLPPAALPVLWCSRSGCVSAMRSRIRSNTLSAKERKKKKKKKKVDSLAKRCLVQ